MIDLHLDGYKSEFVNTLVNSHTVRFRVRIHNGNEEQIGAADENLRILGGAVQVDAKADVTRALDLTLLDPGEKVKLDPDNVKEAAFSHERFISVQRGVWVKQMDNGEGDWVWVPIFWGPLASFDRTGSEVSVMALGKESLMLAPHLMYQSMHLNRGTKVTDGIKRILRHYGETRFDIPDLAYKVRKKGGISIGRWEEGWRAAQRLANSIDRQLYYDARGKAVLRRHQENVVWVFNENGSKADILSEIQVGYDFDNVRNVVVVRGSLGKKDKRQIEAIARPPRTHPLHPMNMQRNGVPRRMIERTEVGHLKNHMEARDVAERKLRSFLRAEQSCSFEALVIPHLEERDVIGVRGDETWMDIHLEQFTIPLSAEEPMSVGYMRKRPIARTKKPRVSIRKWTPKPEKKKQQAKKDEKKAEPKNKS